MSTRYDTTSQRAYEIKVSGRLNQEWAVWFGNMSISVETNSEGATTTTLMGVIPDQAALFGILSRIRDMGLKLISVNQIDIENLFAEGELQNEHHEKKHAQ